MLEIDLEELKILNPQYKRLVIPAYKDPYPLRLKNADILRFIALEDTIYQHKYDELFTQMKIHEGLLTENPTEVYIVKKGDTLGAIAARFRTTVRKLADYNNLRNTHSLSIGQRLRIPPK
jgi:membrane-bound lytic murein transglycosylase D